MLALHSERDALEASGSIKVQSLAEELESVGEELASLRSQCQSMTEILERADAENELGDEDDEPVPVPVSRRLSTAFNQTVQRARGMSMPRQRRSSTVEMVTHGLTKAKSYMLPPAGGQSPECPRMSKDSPPILSYSKGTADATKSLLVSTHSHYGNFRRHSGLFRKSPEPARDPVVVL
ncbi:unnamed protein product [Phytophthora fragariaefolia]|uniref:Unnamed protein product n=1 Tax=Phytophthora fragariaefolia TaxID=1490495 RepID=A0A9W7CHN8_9STRA|nr:unnamed protein product [Phytophthora fragariaefolia]